MEWISVKDRLPDKACYCFVYDDLPRAEYYAKYNKKDGFYYFENEEGDYVPYKETNAKVTHWMPLPEPPKD